MAHHRRGPETDPDHVDRDVDPNEVADLLEGVKRLLPELSGPILSMDVCLYTNSPDGHFIIDTHPEHDSVVMACGFSGHGFKFAPVMGEALADLARVRKDLTSYPVSWPQAVCRGFHSRIAGENKTEVRRNRRLVPTRGHEDTEIHSVFLRGRRQFLSGQSIDVVGRDAAHVAMFRAFVLKRQGFLLGHQEEFLRKECS